MSCTDIVTNNKATVFTDKASILSNKRNKQNFTTLLATHLNPLQVNVCHTEQEEDAGVVIIRKTLELAEDHK